MLFDYMTLKVIWWCFVGVLLIGFALTDGFDFGVGMSLRPGRWCMPPRFPAFMWP